MPKAEEKKASEDANKIVICSWCKRVRIGVNSWLTIDEAEQCAGPTPIPAQSLLSHGICERCFDAVRSDFKT